MKANLKLMTSLFLVFSGCIQSNRSLEKFIDDFSSGIINGTNMSSPNSLTKNIVGLLAIEKNEEGEVIRREICTGTLIEKDIILTAAHCVPANSEIEITFGSNIFALSKETRFASNKIVHEDWLIEETPGVNDIALIKFDGGLPDGFEPAIKATKDQVKQETDVYVFGYGKTSGKFRKPDEDVRQGVGTLRMAKYLAFLQGVEPTSLQLKNKYNQSACQGDSGGPSFVKEGNKMILVGVATYIRINYSDEQIQYLRESNFDIQAFAKHFPEFDFCAGDAYYMNVLHFEEWIRTSINKLNN